MIVTLYKVANYPWLLKGAQSGSSRLPPSPKKHPRPYRRGTTAPVLYSILLLFYGSTFLQQHMLGGADLEEDVDPARLN